MDVSCSCEMKGNTTKERKEYVKNNEDTGWLKIRLILEQDAKQWF